MTHNQSTDVPDHVTEHQCGQEYDSSPTWCATWAPLC